MKINSNHARAAVLGCALVLLSGGAAAGTTLAGNNVSYQFDAGELGLFGSASVVGGNLVFTPAGFSADGTSLFASETINITVLADAGYVLTGFGLQETGGYAGDVENAYATGMFTAIDIEGTTGKQLPVSFNGVNGGGTWTADALIALPASGWGGADGEVTSVTLTLSNQLFATGDASIWKNGVSISATALPVPEADTYAMLLAGLGLVGFMARRRAGHTV